MEENEIELPSNKKFGLFFSLIFFISTIYCFTENLQLAGYFFGSISISFLILALFASHKLKTLNKIWMLFGLYLGIIISPIILGFIYFILITPIAIATRLFGRDELNLKKKKRQSYWTHTEHKLYPETFKNQF